MMLIVLFECLRPNTVVFSDSFPPAAVGRVFVSPLHQPREPALLVDLVIRHVRHPQLGLPREDVSALAAFPAFAALSALAQEHAIALEKHAAQR